MTQQTDQQTRQRLQGKRVAILATHGFEESELAVPRAALQEAGVEVDIVSPEKGAIRAWAETDWGEQYQVDTLLSDASEHDYHGLVLPGGLFNPDTLRQDETALNFVRSFFQAHKPVAAICHAPWILIDAGVVEGRQMTSFPSIAQGLKNAGAEWQDSEVVCDNALVTSRKPADLDAFNAKLLEELAEGKHQHQHA